MNSREEEEYRKGYEEGAAAGPVGQFLVAVLAVGAGQPYSQGVKDGLAGRPYSHNRDSRDEDSCEVALTTNGSGSDSADSSVSDSRTRSASRSRPLLTLYLVTCGAAWVVYLGIPVLVALGLLPQENLHELEAWVRARTDDPIAIAIFILLIPGLLLVGLGICGFILIWVIPITFCLSISVTLCLLLLPSEPFGFVLGVTVGISAALLYIRWVWKKL